MAKVRFGIIGCGGASLPVCEALSQSELAQVSRLYDLDIKLARELAEKYGATACERLEDLLGSAEVDAVYIAVPHDKLFSLAKQALEAHKAVLAEKPMTLTLAQADELIDLADAKHLALGVFYELRHAGPFAQAREIIESGAIGEIIGVRIQTLIDKPLSYWQVGYSARSANPWRAQKTRAGGGLVLMNCSHQLDAVYYLTGLEVVSVSAEAATLTAQVEVEDIAAATFRYNNGALGSLFAGAHLAGSVGNVDECFDIYGTQGQLKVPDVYGTGPLKVFFRQPWQAIKAGEWVTLPDNKVPVFPAAVNDFASAVARGEQAPTSGRDARRALATVLAIYESAHEKRSVSLQRGEV
jgi:predicted dehydrogenase